MAKRFWLTAVNMQLYYTVRILIIAAPILFTKAELRLHKMK
jgi:hypothetical protein